MIASLVFAAAWPSFPPPRSIAMRGARLLIAVALSVASLLSSPSAGGESQPATPVYVNPGEMRSGTLLIKDRSGRYVEAPRVGTDVHVVVSGPTARAHVTQMFHNPSDEWIEAVYVYPLPDGGAVDTLKMVVGDRIIAKRTVLRIDAPAPDTRSAGPRSHRGRCWRPSL